MDQTVGERFARTLATKDFAAAARLPHPSIDFRAMTPSTIWEANTREQIAAEVFPRWYEAHDREGVPRTGRERG
ncbi:MAG: hypothetical protein ACRDJ1_09610 [Actinomycetota bacterium]